MTDPTDSVLRAMTEDGSFRVIVASTRDTAQAIVDAQQAADAAARQVANLLTGTVLVRETMAPQYRVQGILRGAQGAGSIVVDSHPDTTNRGLVRLAEGQDELALTEGTMLQIMRTLLNGQIHQGVVSLAGAKSLSDGLMRYMQTSEQVTSVVDVACVVDAGRVKAAGGYLVQLLPEVAESMLAIMTERLHLFEPMEALLHAGKASPRELMDELLYGMPHKDMGTSPLRFGCSCSHVRILSGISTLSRAEIGELVQASEPLHISCDFCGKDYEIGISELQGLLQPS